MRLNEMKQRREGDGGWDDDEKESWKIGSVNIRYNCGRK
jgi:hypothetical protein